MFHNFVFEWLMSLALMSRLLKFSHDSQLPYTAAMRARNRMENFQPEHKSRNHAILKEEDFKTT